MELDHRVDLLRPGGGHCLSRGIEAYRGQSRQSVCELHLPHDRTVPGAVRRIDRFTDCRGSRAGDSGLNRHGGLCRAVFAHSPVHVGDLRFGQGARRGKIQARCLTRPRRIKGAYMETSHFQAMTYYREARLFPSFGRSSVRHCWRWASVCSAGGAAGAGDRIAASKNLSGASVKDGA